MAFYLDTSAALKLVVVEAGSAAMVRWVGSYDGEMVSSDLMRTELLRATRRAAPTEMTRARAVLDAITLLTIAASTFERAATLDPEEMRILDAIHLAAALELGDDLDGIITYDERLAGAARGLGISVIAPS